MSFNFLFGHVLQNVDISVSLKIVGTLAVEMKPKVFVYEHKFANKRDLYGCLRLEVDRENLEFPLSDVNRFNIKTRAIFKTSVYRE